MSETKVDEFGGEYRVVDGDEVEYSVWLRLKPEQRKALMERARSAGVPLPVLVSRVVEDWLTGREGNGPDVKEPDGAGGTWAESTYDGELKFEDLDKVVGGVSVASSMDCMIRPMPVGRQRDEPELCMPKLLPVLGCIIGIFAGFLFAGIGGAVVGSIVGGLMGYGMAYGIATSGFLPFIIGTVGFWSIVILIVVLWRR